MLDRLISLLFYLLLSQSPPIDSPSYADNAYNDANRNAEGNW
jgi:hypothetical protein